ncbi:MAG TPA: hypothetical protein VK716_01820 [Terracidiphilus sp.]|jgi:hypothetical protein|nr:hypothetical protein [Terracidiphilus sp.]
MIQQANAIETLLADLIDYAGLFPPAALDTPVALANYRAYAQSNHAQALGRFVIDLPRISELLNAAPRALQQIRISLVAPPDFDPGALGRLLDQGLRIESVEIKADTPVQIEALARNLPASCMIYFEVPIHPQSYSLLDTIAAVCARAKLRLGGVVADAFPATHPVAEMLQALADRHIAFKATAGLHHPLRARHPLTYAMDSPTGCMHGFINLLCATAILFDGGDAEDACRILNEENSATFRLTADTLRWNDHKFSADLLRSVREHCLTSIGSCSFTEPIHDLETLGWL